MTILRQPQHKMRRVRNALHAANTHCHWCGVATINPPPSGNPDGATVDHIKPRRECKSQAEYESAANHVLACQECNTERDRVDMLLL